MTKSSTVYDGIFILLIAFICHAFFSRYGFNPTDEGFVLSATNRVMHGQIPHVDFSSVRPLGYAYLHIPELLFYKRHIFLTSRFVFWLEQVLIAFLWIRFILRTIPSTVSSVNKYLLIVVTFIFNVHYFPCSVLHTIDGLLMCLVGINFVQSSKKYAAAGFFFIGFAALCKQNYLLVLPATIILFGRKKAALNLTIGLLPIFLYVLFILSNGGWTDLMIQLGSHNELVKTGILPYSSSRLFYVSILAVLCVSFIGNKLLKIVYIVIVFAVCLYALHTNTYHEKYSFLVFGNILGLYFYELFKKRFSTAILVCLLLAWCVSVSVGYNTPALFLGGCLSLWLYLLFADSAGTPQKLEYATYFIVIAALIFFYYTRTTNIYRDANKASLCYRLDDIVEGADGIYTNKNTFDVLTELDSLKRNIPNLIVLPDFTACSVLHSNTSVIKTEWPNKTEVPNKKILQKVIHELETNTSVAIAIPKYNTAFLSIGLFKIEKRVSGKYLIMDYLYTNYNRYTSNSYFDIYKRK